MSKRRRVTLPFFIAVGVYVAIAAGACAIQRSMMFPAPPPRDVDTAGGELLRIPGANGTTVFALHFAAQGGAPTIVYFHGNGEQLADVAPLAAALHESGLGVLAVEYPGYGMSARDAATESTIYDAADRAVRHLREAGVDRAHLVLVGQSLGTGVATEMASRGYASRLVLLSPYTSMVDMAWHVAPFLPMSILVRDRFDNARKAPHIAIPVLIVHGSDDEVIPVAMGQTLGRRFPNASVVVVPHAHHNDLWASPSATLLARVVRFASGT
jgi:pimeloyl-ACP methyl ester carboxylesterase